MDFGVIGLGVMGQNLALNIGNKGFSVAGFDLDQEKLTAAQQKWAGKNMVAVGALRDLVERLDRPRRLLMMVPAGKPVDAVISDLKPLLSPGDILIDGGNSYFGHTDRREKELAAAGIHYMGMGVSGGAEGALNGPALMPGGDRGAYDAIELVLTAIAAKTDEGPCSGYIGQGGAGHYVKMVHNGIEYGIMQLISETYDIMKNGLGMSAGEMQRVFAEWNAGDLNSYLIEITAAVLAKTDDQTGKPFVDVVLDKAGQKGTGKWTSQNALDLCTAIPTINAALQGRILSAMKDQRVAASRVLTGPSSKFEADSGFLSKLRDALRLSILTCYAQGFSLMRAASMEYKYNLDFVEIARIWMGGCIIRAKVLKPIRAAFEANRRLVNLLVDERFSGLVNSLSGSAREVTAKAVEAGIPVLAFNGSLGYIDSYRREQMPQNLLQAQRNYFGGHAYERVDKPRVRTAGSDASPCSE